MIEYVLGFLFNDQGDRVVLIRKNKPKWQAGLLNGVGGKVEPREVPMQAMIREFKEEAGVETSWKSFLHLTGPDWTVHCFKSFNSKAYHKVQSMTDEKLEKHLTRWLWGKDCVDNLYWIIPFALDFMAEPATVEYRP